MPAGRAFAAWSGNFNFAGLNNDGSGGADRLEIFTNQIAFGAGPRVVDDKKDGLWSWFRKGLKEAYGYLFGAQLAEPRGAATEKGDEDLVQQASKAVQQAQQALESASRIATQYGQSL